MRHYILDDNGKPVPASFWDWAVWFEEYANRCAFRTDISEGVYVSTIFLGIDHNFQDDGPPLLWETMAFGLPSGQEQSRCAGSREQAEAMHEDMVDRMGALLALTL